MSLKKTALMQFIYIFSIFAWKTWNQLNQNPFKNDLAMDYNNYKDFITNNNFFIKIKKNKKNEVI